MADLGAPVSYLVLAEGVPVFALDGEEVGTVAHVLADPEADVFDGLVVGDRLADSDQVAEIHERGVRLSVVASELHAVSESPATMRADPAAGPDGALTAKLRRAWDLISGRY